MAFIGIVAITKNFAIGKDGKLPWHHSADLKFFKQTTLGNTVVMGSNTWRSIGKPLPGRLNVVITKGSDIAEEENVKVLSSVDQVAELSKNIPGDIFIIGGAQIFASFAPVIDKWIVTDVPDDVPDADTFMPRDFLVDFEERDSLQLADNLRVRILHRVKK